MAGSEKLVKNGGRWEVGLTIGGRWEVGLTIGGRWEVGITIGGRWDFEVVILWVHCSCVLMCIIIILFLFCVFWFSTTLGFLCVL